MDEFEFFHRLQQCTRCTVASASQVDVRAGVWREIASREAGAAEQRRSLSLWRDSGAQAMLAAGLAIVVGAGLLMACYGEVVRDIDWMAPYLGWFHRILPLV